jgi:membrane-anchored protein YejM (alkaline phosphatase superfamily)
VSHPMVGRNARAGLSAFLWIYWLVLVTFGAKYIAVADGYSSSASGLFCVLALAGQMGTFVFLVGLLPLLALLLKQERLSSYLCAFIATLVLCFLLVDIKLYELYRFHFNAFALNVIFTPGGFETMGVSHRDLALGAGLVVAIFFACFGVLQLLTMYYRARELQTSPRVGRYLIWAVLFFVVSERAVYAWGDFKDHSEITKNVAVMPLYEPFQIRGNLVQIFGDPVDQPDAVQAPAVSSRLKYPGSEFAVKVGNPLNVLVVAIESVRADMLNPQVMPNLWKLAETSQVFRGHHSGGNATRFGIFSLAYGMDGLYWQSFLAERRGPILFSALRNSGYEIKSWTSMPANYPEFRQTVFVNDTETLEDKQPGELPWQRDDAIRSKFVDFMAARKNAPTPTSTPTATKGRRPFFGFVFFDGPHAPYSYPKDRAVFSEAGEQEQSYFEILDRKNAAGTFARYKNSLHYADYNLGLMLDALADAGELDNTIVYVTGDHGQEFWEYGYYGHNGAFNPMQVMVPSVLRVPGMAPASFSHWTSHQDVVPTIFSLLKADPDPTQFTSGRNLFDISASDRDHVVVCSFTECSLRDEHGWIVFGTQEKKSFKLAYFDANYRPVSRTVGATPSRLARLREFFARRAFLKD